MGTGRKMGTFFPKGIKKFLNGYRVKKWEHFSQKVLRNSSMGTGPKMGTFLQKGIKKFVNGYRVREIRQWVQSEIVNHIYDKNDHFYNNLR